MIHLFVVYSGTNVLHTFLVSSNMNHLMCFLFVIVHSVLYTCVPYYALHVSCTQFIELNITIQHII